MKRWIGLFIPIVLVLLLTSFGRIPFLKKNVEVPSFLLQEHDGKASLVLPEDQHKIGDHDFINVGKTYLGFKEALGFKESQGRYDTINKLGYLGKYQFGKNTLKLLGVDNTDEFLSDAALQEKAFESNIARNKWILRRDIKRFTGKKINGARITESGIVAAAHLAGAGNVKKYLRSYGKEDFSDAFGSSVAFYMKKFAGYDVSEIKQQRNSKVN